MSSSARTEEEAADYTAETKSSELQSEEKTDTHIHDEEYVLAKIFHARPTIILILRRRRFLSLNAPRRLNDGVSLAQPRSVHLD